MYDPGRPSLRGSWMIWTLHDAPLWYETQPPLLAASSSDVRVRMFSVRNESLFDMAVPRAARVPRAIANATIANSLEASGRPPLCSTDWSRASGVAIKCSRQHLRCNPVP